MSLNLQKGTNALIDLEEKFLRDLQQAPSRVHNALRNVGKFPLIITTNMDELVERFLWKTGNGGEKLRLDQVGKMERRFALNVSASKLFFSCVKPLRGLMLQTVLTKVLILFCSHIMIFLIKPFIGSFSEANDSLFVPVEYS